MYYFGYKHVSLSTWKGVLIAYDLVPANTDERVAIVRQRIEGVFHEIQNTGRNPERLRNKYDQTQVTQEKRFRLYQCSARNASFEMDLPGETVPTLPGTP
ncbi:hypothetical protein [Alkalinema sp. FACHB-956]|uniref:hypothetical protein n=1 Tax=Alkalinema sp. FACHB-956 TaxID=2692768 RepID=UPI001685D7B0|nr:hypothetical protein [Alkalinema sp. FACHB-956]MBD2329769.1 hypothetical protein [Alkalinema sp. FACHB-956]